MKTTNLKRKQGLKRGAIRKRGNQTLEYERWRKEIAIPYLLSEGPYVCARGCGKNYNLDVGHKLARSTHPHLKMVLSNLEFQCQNFNRWGSCEA